ncbi:Inner membrane protein ycdZ [Kluyvera intermedia]|nr:Inner membrane protein ycdZ [Kluyvera intermedia]
MLVISSNWRASAKMPAMNVILAIAITTGLLSGIWGWVAVSLGLLSWAGFLGCTAYFACPTGGLKGLAISGSTTLSGVIWALVIIYGSALAPHLEIVSYVMTGIVAFLMCIQARQRLLAFVPGTFIGACATFAGQGDWKLVVPSLLVGLVFGYAMKNSGLWLANRKAKSQLVDESAL